MAEAVIPFIPKNDTPAYFPASETKLFQAGIGTKVQFNRTINIITAEIISGEFTLRNGEIRKCFPNWSICVGWGAELVVNCAGGPQPVLRMSGSTIELARVDGGYDVNYGMVTIYLTAFF